MKRFRREAVVAACALALSACGGSASALEQTAEKLDDIRSGVLTLEAGVAPSGSGEAFSYELTGPFEFPEDGGVASADLRYRQTRGDTSEEARLVVDEGAGWIEIDGERRELSEEQLAGLVVGTEDENFLDGLDLESWFVRSQTQEGADDTLTITGEAHAGRTLAGLMGLAGGLGEEGALELDDENEERIDRLARRSELEVVTGADDHLLRRLRYELTLGFDVSRELRAALGEVDGATLTFDLEIGSPNEPVEIGG